MKTVSSYFMVTANKDLSKENESKIIDVSENIFIKLQKKSISKEDFLEVFILLLSLNEKNIDIFNSLEISKEVYNIVDDKQKDLELDLLKTGVLICFKKALRESIYSKNEITFLISLLKKLYDEKFISKTIFVNLKIMIDGLFPKEKLTDKIEIRSVETENIEELFKDSNEKDKEIYNQRIKKINSIIDTLNVECNSFVLKQKLEEIQATLKDSKFSIGITGVMNAGKSTMLNAMLEREILGTSVIPETANLSIIRYSNDERAKVHFWNKYEWEQIKKSGDQNPAIKEFVNDTEYVFKENLSQFVQDEDVVKDIPIHELASYTSAKLSDMKCNLVKSVELFTNLKFVQGGVEIVDTPGIDDPVIQREDITKEYLSKCDVMIHLMNANQSATQKDIDFIIDALLYQNITRLLIVITRIDTISKNELEEVIEYTKQSLNNQLKKINKSGKIDEVTSKIDFVPIAGKMALLHRIGEGDKALEKGYDLSKSGILEVEKYLSGILFGADSPKAKLIIDGNKNKIRKALDERVCLLEYEYSNIGKSVDELKSVLVLNSSEKEQISNRLTIIKNEISNQKNVLEEYIKSLDNFIKTELDYFEGRMVTRISENITYEAKNGKKLENDVVKFMIEFGIKDGLIDIIRDYKYQFQKKIQSATDIIEQNYCDFEKDLEKKYSREFDFKNLFGNDFNSGFLSKNNILLISKITAIVDKTTKRNIDKVDELVKSILKDGFADIYSGVYKKAYEVNEKIISTFVNSVMMPIQTIEESLNEKEKLIKEQISKIENSQSDDIVQKETIQKELTVIKTELDKIEGI